MGWSCEDSCRARSPACPHARVRRGVVAGWTHLNPEDRPDRASEDLDRLKEEHAPSGRAGDAKQREGPNEAQAEIEGAQESVQSFILRDQLWCNRREAGVYKG